jgi:hypothetical protein
MAQKRKKNTFLSRHYLRNRLPSDVGMLGYIDVKEPNKRSPELLQIPPETPCIASVECMYVCMCEYGEQVL